MQRFDVILLTGEKMAEKTFNSEIKLNQKVNLGEKNFSLIQNRSWEIPTPVVLRDDDADDDDDDDEEYDEEDDDEDHSV